MRLSHSHKFVFLATPRTASTSVRSALDEYSDIKSVYKAQVTKSFPYYHHISAAEMMELFELEDWDWMDYNSACFVRNPYDRVVSLYHHYLETGTRIADGKSWIYNSVRSLRYKKFPLKSFERYVETLDVSDRLVMPVSSFAADKSGSLCVKNVLKFEELPSCFVQWTSKVGLTKAGVSLKQSNASMSRDDYRKYYTDATRSIVAEKYAEDFELFGYDI